MFLNKIYCNKPDIFPEIVFNRGLNVIFARVKHRDDETRDSHNLGKTLLIDLLEFMLLKGVDEEFFLKKHHDKFLGFEFYLDIGLCDGKYLTIKRTSDKTSTASFKKHDKPDETFDNLNGEDWDHEDIPFQRSLDLLNSYLKLKEIRPWSFRKGVSYLLRKQKDYLDPFQISKYISGHHQDWKPFMARILGLDDQMLTNRYELGNKLERLSQKKQGMQRDLLHREEDYDKIKGRVQIKRQDLIEKSEALDDFDFHQRELGLNTTLVEELESRISELNDELYNTKYDIEKIHSSLQSKLHFDLAKIKKIFEETELNFPGQLERQYEDLVSFNKKITQERNRHLRKRVNELKQRYEELKVEHKTISLQRQEILKVLKGRESLRKFKDLQKSLDKDRADLELLESQLAKLEEAIELNKDIAALNKKVESIKSDIAEMHRKGSDTYETVRRAFTEIIRNVLNAEALLSTKLNKEGNLEFNTEFIENKGSKVVTSEADGTTYKKFLCMAFDMAVLRAYHQAAFYHFVYHDGALETLDDRKKTRLLRAVRDFCQKYDVQYILSAIEDDLPRDSDGKTMAFAPQEIVRELHDSGDDGRLFRMPKF